MPELWDTRQPVKDAGIENTLVQQTSLGKLANGIGSCV
jgi:hypothetical protein